MSKLALVLSNIGFTTQIVSGKKIPASKIHQAIITNIYLAGYLKPQLIWQAINLIDHKNPNYLYNKNAKLVFSTLCKAIKKSGALQDDPKKFKADILIKNLFAEDIFDNQDVEDFLVYLICQNAFGRVKNQERNEIIAQNWMLDHKAQYLKNAWKIGVIDETKPRFSEYDETWIMGAARYRTIDRINRAKKIKDSGINIGKTRLLSGNRELWVEIDNINGNIDEAKDFILKLAKQNDIKIDKKQPFIARNVIGHQRTYLNYSKNEKKKLTETVMSKAIYREIFDCNPQSTIDDTSNQDSRPTTESTVEAITNNIFKHRLENCDFKNKKEILILIISNQPFIERQRLTTKRVVDRIIGEEISKKIIFDGVGTAAHQPVSTIHSEFSALVSEKFWQYTKKFSTIQKRKRAPQKIIFSTRHNDISFIPKMPKL